MAKLHVIDFSDGIRSEEIQENFEILNDEISRERLSTGGSGIASGLDITPIVTDTQFAIKISAASIIDKNGDEIFINEQIINIDRPKLSRQLEYLVADVNNQVRVKEVPYMVNRVCPVQYGDSLAPALSGINILYQNSTSTDDYIRVKAVNGKTLTLTGLTRRQVAVSYFSTAKRIDTVYIDKNNNICVKSSSITSTTPSAIIPEEYNYLIAFIMIEPEYTKDGADTPHAFITIKKDLRTPRNIYTDSDGTLYLCGTSFDDLHLITTEEPLNPKPDHLWLDNGTLYVWKAVDEYTYKRSIEITSDRNFEGHNDFTTEINYLVGKNQLKIYINSVQLNDSEYDEMFGDLPASIQIIPEGTESNKFRIYNAITAGDILTYEITFTESGYRWIPVNKESYMNTREYKIFGVDSVWAGGNYWSSPRALCLGETVIEDTVYPNKFQYFLFDADTDRQMIFSPGYNQVSVMVNQVPLHRDQFIEISLENLYSLPPAIQNAIKNDYGWSDSKLNTMDALYDDIGIGVMLVEPLDCIANEGVVGTNNTLIQEDELYVEITVERHCSTVNSNRKLQRSAVYIYEDSLVVEDTFENKVNISDEAFYRYNENQLEVYINGTKLVKNVDFREGSDLSIPEYEEGYVPPTDGDEEHYDPELGRHLRLRGSISRQFEILRPIYQGDIISYRITSNFFSYDHVNSLIDRLEIQQDSCNAKVETLYNSTLEFCQNTDAALTEIKREVSFLSGKDNSLLNTYLTTSSIIPEEQIAANVVNRIPQSVDHILHVIDFNDYPSLGYNVSDILRVEDFTLIFWRDADNMNADRMLLPELDYVLVQEINASNVVSVSLRLTETALSKINAGDQLIIRGIKFGRAGR